MFIPLNGVVLLGDFKSSKGVFAMYLSRLAATPADKNVCPTKAPLFGGADIVVCRTYFFGGASFSSFLASPFFLGLGRWKPGCALASAGAGAAAALPL